MNDPVPLLEFVSGSVPTGTQPGGTFAQRIAHLWWEAENCRRKALLCFSRGQDVIGRDYVKTAERLDAEAAALVAAGPS